MSDEAFRERMELAGDLGLHLAEHLWSYYSVLHLGGEDFEVASTEEVPGFSDDDMAVLIRRKSDGKVFEVEIEATVRIVHIPGEVRS